MDRLRSTPRELLALATASEGILDRAELVAAGLSEAAIDSRVRRGRLAVAYQGIYVAPHLALSDHARRDAALRAVPGGALSGAAAAEVWQMGGVRGAPLEVVTPGRARSRAGLVVHRTRWLPPEHVALVDGLRVTTPARVLLDMAARWTVDELLRAAGDAEVRRVFDYDTFMALQTNGRRGGRRIRRLQALMSEGTRSKLEQRVRALCARAGLPEPIGQFRVAGRRLDLAWPRERFAIEAQSWRHHGIRPAFEDDARKQALARAAGWEILPVTWRQIEMHPREVVEAIRAGLASGVLRNRSR